MPDTPDLTRNDEIVLAAVRSRLARHDQAFAMNWPAERNQLRLALATIEDEHREAHEAWHEDKKSGDWTRVADELLDVAAVALRALRELADPYLRADLTRQHMSAWTAGDHLHESEGDEHDIAPHSEKPARDICAWIKDGRRCRLPVEFVPEGTGRASGWRHTGGERDDHGAVPERLIR